MFLYFMVSPRRSSSDADEAGLRRSRQFGSSRVLASSDSAGQRQAAGLAAGRARKQQQVLPDCFRHALRRPRRLSDSCACALRIRLTHQGNIVAKSLSRIDVYIGCTCVGWGIASTLQVCSPWTCLSLTSQATAFNKEGIWVCRFFVGMFEAMFVPAIVRPGCPPRSRSSRSI